MLARISGVLGVWHMSPSCLVNIAAACTIAAGRCDRPVALAHAKVERPIRSRCCSVLRGGLSRTFPGQMPARAIGGKPCLARSCSAISAISRPGRQADLGTWMRCSAGSGPSVQRARRRARRHPCRTCLPASDDRLGSAWPDGLGGMPRPLQMLAEGVRLARTWPARSQRNQERHDRRGPCNAQRRIRGNEPHAKLDEEARASPARATPRWRAR